MLGGVAIIFAIVITVIIAELYDYEKDKERESNYKYGYNDCLLDIDEMLQNLTEQGVSSVRIEHIRNRIALEYLED